MTRRLPEVSPPKHRLLVVDDDPLIHEALRMVIPSHWELAIISSPHALPSAAAFSAAMVDLHLSSRLEIAEGLDVLRRLHEDHPVLEIIAMSGDLNRELMEQTLAGGATRFLSKPLSGGEVRVTLEKIEALIALRSREHEPLPAASGNSWIGISNASDQVRRAIAQLRGETGPILIEGESGTGKEVAALLLHHQERRRTVGPRPFISVNLGGIPESVFESEFFGHLRGSFSGASENRMGLAEAAQGGDLFLDEVEALPMASQAKLLRFLETGEVRRIGSQASIKVDVRVIAATNRRLDEMVRAGQLREDLHWRLAGKSLRLPPLRQRKEDIASLAQHFLNGGGHRVQKEWTEEALRRLEQHDWPGNVRELRRRVEQVVLLSPLPIIRAVDVDRVLPQRSSDPVVDRSPAPIELRQGLSALVEKFESDLVHRALNETESVDEAAQLLGISRSTLYKKLKSQKSVDANRG